MPNIILLVSYFGTQQIADIAPCYAAFVAALPFHCGVDQAVSYNLSRIAHHFGATTLDFLPLLLRSVVSVGRWVVIV